MKEQYMIVADRSGLVQYLATDYGIRGAARILRGVKPFGEGEESYPRPPHKVSPVHWAIPVPPPEIITLTMARAEAGRISSMITWQDGRRGAPRKDHFVEIWNIKTGKKFYT